MELIAITLIILAVVYKLGLFNPVVDLSQVATRESSVYNREHKVKVAKRYEKLATDIDVKAVNDAIKQVDALKFDQLVSPRA